MKDLEDDERLVNAALAGDSAAEERLYNEYVALVNCTVRKVLKNSDDVEDLVQETFIQIFRKLHSFAGDSRLRTWIYRVAFNQSLMHLRHRAQKIMKKTEAGDDALKFLPASSVENPSKVIEKIIFNEAFAQLAEGYAQVLYLHDALGLEHSEVAAVLGVAEGTSKSQLHKARKKMRQEINRTGNIKRQSATEMVA